MSTESEFSSDVNLEIFKEKVTVFLEISFIAFVALTVIGIGFYLSVVRENVQNSLPLLLTIYLAAFTWILRAKITDMPPQEIRIFLLQWIVISVLIIVSTVALVVFYPYSQILS